MPKNMVILRDQNTLELLNRKWRSRGLEVIQSISMRPVAWRPRPRGYGLSFEIHTTCRNYFLFPAMRWPISNWWIFMKRTRSIVVYAIHYMYISIDIDTRVLVNALKSAQIIIREGLVFTWRFVGPSAPLMGPF